MSENTEVERIVWAQGSGSELMEGDPDREADDYKRQSGLPYLLSRGWRIKTTVPDGKGGVYFILTGKPSPAPSQGG